jgi:hypothetical protein
MNKKKTKPLDPMICCLQETHYTRGKNRLKVKRRKWYISQTETKSEQE